MVDSNVQLPSSEPQKPGKTLTSPLLEEALDSFKKELNNGNDFVVQVNSVEDLLNQAKSLERALPRKSGPSNSLTRLEPILSQLSNFAAIMALCFGTNVETAAIVWGSLRLILSLAAAKEDVLEDVLDMLEEISWSLPRFTQYEKELPMDEPLRSSLVAATIPTVCLLSMDALIVTDIIIYSLLRNGWHQLAADSKKTITRLKRLSHIVQTEAEAARMRQESEKHSEVLAVIKAFQETSIKKQGLPLYHVPLGLNEKFFGREEEIRIISETLDPQDGDRRSRSLAIHGMGGVGKTSIALQYTNRSRNRFDAIFWISADNMVKMTQDFLDVAKKLDLVPQDRKSEDANMAMSKVKTWLNETTCSWLVVFDNADDLDIVSKAWPGSACGSILITSRDFTAGFSPASNGLNIDPFDDSTGSKAFLEFIGQSDKSSSNLDLSSEITRRLGGLPLALRQISGFIVKQRLALKDFLPLYERNALKINARSTGPRDYQHTLSTVWSLALSQLEGNASCLQKLLAFFDPDKINEEILTTEDNSASAHDEFDFLSDEMDFLDAKEMLLKSALIGRSEEGAYLTVHRLVQEAVLEKLTKEEGEKYFHQAVKLLGRTFPCFWKNDLGYTFTVWNICEICVPHVLYLVKLFTKRKIGIQDPEALVTLLLCCAWYLFECERAHEGVPLVHFAMEHIVDKESILAARAYNILGALSLDSNHPRRALEGYSAAFKIRERLLPPDDPDIARSLSNLSLAYSELRDFETAATYQQKALDIRLRTNSPLIGNSYANFASITLGLGKPDEAEELLWKIPALKDKTNKAFLLSSNPRLSTDMLLLSRIRVCQGRIEDALRLRSEALAFRQSIYGDKYKTSDSLYQVADLLHMRGDSASAIDLLEKSLVFLANLPEAEGFMARANFKLAQIYEDLGTDAEAARRCKDAAIAYKAKAQCEVDVGPEYTEENFNRLVPWMPW